MSLSLEKQADLLKSIHILGILSRCMEIEFANDMVDTKFKSPNINNHNRKIKESLTAIKSTINSGLQPFKVKSQEYMEYDYAVQMYRVIDHFTDMGLDVITEFMDEVDKLKKQNNI